MSIDTYTQNSELRSQKLFITPYTHLQNKIQCINNNVDNNVYMDQGD